MRWNIVIGVATAVCALVQLAMTAVGYFNPDGLSASYGDMLFSAVALLALLLSYPLLRGRNWARVTLVILLSLCAIGVALLVPFLFIANPLDLYTTRHRAFRPVHSLRHLSRSSWSSCIAMYGVTLADRRAQQPKPIDDASISLGGADLVQKGGRCKILAQSGQSLKFLKFVATPKSRLRTN
jgi:hypothetical protein